MTTTSQNLPTSASSIEITPIDADRVRDAARLHRAAFARSMNTRLGDGYVRALIDWFRRQSETIAFVALDADRRAVGYVLGAPLGYTRAMNKALLAPASIGLMLHPGLLFDGEFRKTLVRRVAGLVRGDTPRTDEPKLPPPVMSLVGIGVDPASQGRGIGRLLLAEFERRAAAQSAVSLRLTVYADNGAARALYEKGGWQACLPRDDRYQTLFYSKPSCTK